MLQISETAGILPNNSPNFVAIKENKPYLCTLLLKNKNETQKNQKRVISNPPKKRNRFAGKAQMPDFLCRLQRL